MSFEASTALDEGIRLLQENDLPGALVRFQQAVQESPANGRAHGYLGIVQCRLGDLAAGIGALKEAARLQPQDASAQYNLGVALAQAQRAPEARAALEQALVLDPGNARARAALQALPPEAPAAAVAPQPVAPAPLSNDNDLRPVGSGNYSRPDLTSAPTMMATPMPELSTTAPPPAGGMQYSASMPQPRRQAMEPSAGQRILRGLGWGALFGQWWTIWIMFWDVIMGSTRSGESATFGFILTALIVLGIAFALAGGIAGLIIGAVNATPEMGAMVGVVFGLLLLGGEYLLRGSAMVFINIIFWFFTGRFIGRNIALRVQRPVVQ